MGQLLAGLRITRDRRPSKPRLPVTALEIHMPLRAMLETANVSRETVSRVLASLERRGVIAKQGRRIAIRDLVALRSIAMG